MQDPRRVRVTWTALVVATVLSPAALAVQAERWVMPSKVADFTGPSPTTTTLPGSPPSSYEWANGVHDPQGNLRFYVADSTVYDGGGGVIGSLYFGGLFFNHEIAIVPFPNDCDRYYVFYHNNQGLVGVELLYAVVDLNTNTLSSVDVLVGAYGDNFLTMAVGNRRGDDSRFLYVISNPQVDQYLVDASGVTFSQTVATSFGSPPVTEYFPSEADLSHDGRRLAWTSPTGFSHNVTMLDLDGSGSLLTAHFYTVGDDAHGVEFSPDGQTLYVSSTATSGSGVHYLPLPSGPATLMTGSSSYGNTQLELAFDGKIYAASSADLGSIAAPNLPTPSGFTAAAVPGLIAGLAGGTGTRSLPDQVDGQVYDLWYAECPDCARPPRGMTAWWPLDEATGSAVSVDIVHGNNGSRLGLPTGAAGQVGLAADLDGIDDYLAVADAPELDFGTGDLSIDLWLKAPNDRLIQTLLDKRAVGSPRGYWLYLFNGALQFQLQDGASQTFASGAPAAFVADDTWHHVAVTVDRDEAPDGLRFYVDGVEIDSFDPTTRSGDLSTTSDLWIGRRHDDLTHYHGRIDEIELFDRELSGSEVAAIADAGDAGKCKEACHASWDVQMCSGADSATIGVDICNYGTTTQSYSYELQGVLGIGGSPGSTCNVDGPLADDVTYLDPNPVSVAPGACVRVDVEIDRPADLNANNLVACYDISVSNDATDSAFACKGSLWDRRNYCAVGIDDPIGITVDEIELVEFEVTNFEAPSDVLEYSVMAMASDGRDDEPILSLDGLEPGQVTRGAIELPPGGQGTVRVEVRLTEAAPFGFQDLLLLADDDGDGIEDVIGASMVRPLGGTDCDDNGIMDGYDELEGRHYDCDGDGVAESCAWALELTQSPLIPGEAAELIAVGAAPGERVYFLRGTEGAGCGACPEQLGGRCLDIAGGFSVLGQTEADASGVALLTIVVPRDVPLLELTTQAVALRGDAGEESIRSNPVTAPIEP